MAKRKKSLRPSEKLMACMTANALGNIAKHMVTTPDIGQLLKRGADERKGLAGFDYREAIKAIRIISWFHNDLEWLLNKTIVKSSGLMALAELLETTTATAELTSHELALPAGLINGAIRQFKNSGCADCEIASWFEDVKDFRNQLPPLLSSCPLYIGVNRMAGILRKVEDKLIECDGTPTRKRKPSRQKRVPHFTLSHDYSKLSSDQKVYVDRWLRFFRYDPEYQKLKVDRALQRLRSMKDEATGERLIKMKTDWAKASHKWLMHAPELERLIRNEKAHADDGRRS